MSVKPHLFIYVHTQKMDVILQMYIFCCTHPELVLHGSSSRPRPRDDHYLGRVGGKVDLAKAAALPDGLQCSVHVVDNLQTVLTAV